MTGKAVYHLSRLCQSSAFAAVALPHTWNQTGTGVHVYVLDTGIRTTHEQFYDPVAKRSRAQHGFDAVSNSGSSEDCHGHGSHVAAVVGGASVLY